MSKSIVSIGIREVSGEPGRENAAGDYIDRDPVPVRFNVVVDGRVEGCCEDLGPRTTSSLGDMGCGFHMGPVGCIKRREPMWGYRILGRRRFIVGHVVVVQNRSAVGFKNVLVIQKKIPRPLVSRC